MNLTDATYLMLEAARTTESAAIAASDWIGRGDEKSADKAAVDAMRSVLGTVTMQGVVVIGEGERDEAPMLYIGEKVGTGKGAAMDIALDPLEGTTLCATHGAGALAVLAFAQKGNFLHAPDVYMDKIAVGGGLPDGVVQLENTPKTNLKNLAKAKGCDVSDLLVSILNRPRHAELIAKVREAGARIQLLQDGDVAAVMTTAMPETGVAMYVGTGGAPEGVLAAAALVCLGGQMQGRLLFQDEKQITRASTMGITDPQKIYDLRDMARGDVIFSATGVTDGALLNGIVADEMGVATHSMVMCSLTRTIRTVHTVYQG
jgi:fructose-1,6-bisphosphatase II / sedoheptulose-1,7-bisphosphatase